MPLTNGKCARCFNVIPNREFLNCSLCKLSYDLLCANVPFVRFRIMEPRHKNTWICKSCHNKQRRGNTPTPQATGVQSATFRNDLPSSSDRENVTERRKPSILMSGKVVSMEVVSPLNQSLTACSDTPVIKKPVTYSSVVTSERIASCNYQAEHEVRKDISMKLLFEHVLALGGQLENVIASINLCHDKMDECSSKIDMLDERLQAIEATTGTNQCLPRCHCEYSNEQNDIPKKSKIRRKRRGSKATPEATVVSTSPPELNDNDTPSLQSNVVPSPLPDAPIPQLENKNSSDAEVGNSSEQSDGDSAEDGTTEWVEVRYKHRSASRLCTAGPDVTSLKAVEPRKFIHLWNMMSGVDDIRNYLQKLCGTENCTVDELKPRGNYKSYKIGVPEEFYKTCISIDTWPINARVKAWTSFRGPSNNQRNPTRQ